MEYDNKKSAFLELMKCGIWGTAPDLTVFQQITPSDWFEIYQIAGKQTVLGICLKPVMDLPDKLQPPTKLLMQWVGLNRYIEANSLKKIQAWKNLSSQLIAAGFTPIVFKGLSVAKWYANPLSRQFSDIDVFIPERFDELIQALKKSGIKCEHKPQHDSMVYDGVPIELHSKIITIPFQPSLKCFAVKEKITEDLVIHTSDPNTTSLVLLSHAAGHFLIPGIGYRFLCDWAVYLKHNHQHINVDLVLREVRRMGMEHFVTEFTKLAEVQLGLCFEGLNKWTEGSNEKYLRRLSDKLFENGDFGAVNFKKDYKGHTFQLGWNTVKSLSSRWYYWPKLFWRKTPIYLIKFNLLLLMRRLHLPV